MQGICTPSRRTRLTDQTPALIHVQEATGTALGLVTIIQALKPLANRPEWQSTIQALKDSIVAKLGQTTPTTRIRGQIVALVMAGYNAKALEAAAAALGVYHPGAASPVAHACTFENESLEEDQQDGLIPIHSEEGNSWPVF